MKTKTFINLFIMSVITFGAAMTLTSCDDADDGESKGDWELRNTINGPQWYVITVKNTGGTWTGEGELPFWFEVKFSASKHNFSSKLFYYKDGAIEWMTKGAAADRINVVYLDGSWFGVRTIAFCKSPAYDGGPLAASKAAMNVKNYAICELEPELSLSKIRQRVTGGPNYDAARECFLFLVSEVSEDESDGVQEIRELTVTALKDGRTRRFTLDKVNVMEPQTVPAMAVKSEGTVYPGRVTHMIHSLNEDGVAADGTPLEETMSNGLLFKTTYTWQRPLNILTASDQVSVAGVDVYSDTFEKLHSDVGISFLDDLDPGTYYLCFRTTVLGPYSEKVGRYTYQTDYTIYKVKWN